MNNWMKMIIKGCVGLLIINMSNTVLADNKKNNIQKTSTYQYYGKELCAYPEFRCVQIKSGVSWRALWPDPIQREMVMRLNRTNESIYSRPWIVIPKNLASISYLQLSPFPEFKNTSGKRLILVNLKLQAFAAYDQQGHLVHWGPASGGKNYCSDVKRKCTTPSGVYSIQRKKGFECISSKYPIEKGGGAKMPYCMFFNGGYGLHGSTTLPGYNASHGCVRLFVDDAKWLNQNFALIGTSVIISN